MRRMRRLNEESDDKDEDEEAGVDVDLDVDVGFWRVFNPGKGVL